MQKGASLKLRREILFHIAPYQKSTSEDIGKLILVETFTSLI